MSTEPQKESVRTPQSGKKRARKSGKTREPLSLQGLLYEHLDLIQLENSSATLEWISDAGDGPGEMNRFLLGTYDTKSPEEHLLVTSVRPLDPTDNQQPSDPKNSKEGWLRVDRQWIHKGDVNRARVSPQNRAIVATISSTGDVNLFDISESSTATGPKCVLDGHSEEGYGLAWCPTEEGRLLTSSDDSSIYLWDVKGGSCTSRVAMFSRHDMPVGDVSWSPGNPSIFASAGDDQRLLLWDTREEGRSPVLECGDLHDSAINCVAFHTAEDQLIATGAADGAVGLFDSRNPKALLYVLSNHQGQVYQLGWHPQRPNILASAAGDSDCRVLVWDLDRIGDLPPPVDDIAMPPELLFAHDAHENGVRDFGWSPRGDTLASVDGGQQMHILRPRVLRTQDKTAGAPEGLA